MIKKILIGILFLFLLVIAGVISVPFLFKDKIFEVVKSEINKNVIAKIDFGDFDLTILSSFPDLTISLNNLNIEGINEFSGDTLAAIKELTATLDIMTVIRGEQITVKTVRINNSRILAKVLKDGKANWDIAPSTENPDNAETTGSSKFKVSLQHYELNDAHIVYDDAELPCYVVMDGLTHQGEGDFTQDIFVLQTKTTAQSLDLKYDGMVYLKRTNMNFSADLEMDLKNWKYTLKDNELQLNDLFLGFEGIINMPDTNIDMDVKFYTRKTDFRSLLSMIPSAYTSDFTNVKTSGKLALDGFVKGTYNAVSMPAYGINLLVENAMFKYPELPAAVHNIQIDANVNNPDGIDDHTVINVPKFHLEFDKEPFDARFVLKTPVSDLDIDAQLKGKIDLAQVTKTFPLEGGMKLSGVITTDVSLQGKLSVIEQEKYEEFDAKGQVNINNLVYESPDMSQGMSIRQGQMIFNPKNLTLNSFDCQIGKSDIKASGSFENYLAYVLKDETLKGNVNLVSNNFDANELLQDENTSGSTSTAQPDTAPLTVVEIPANLDISMTTQFKKILYEDKVIENMSGSLAVKDQRASMDNLKLNILDAAFVMSGVYSTINIKKPDIKFNISVSNIDIQKSFKTFVTVRKLAPIAEYTSGNSSVDFDVTGSLTEYMEPEYSSLNGAGKMIVHHAEIKGFKPLKKMAEVVKVKELENMTVDNLQASFKIVSGRVYVHPFELKQKEIKMMVSGSSGFDQTIDYLVKSQIPRKMFGTQANAIVDNLLALANQKGAALKIEDDVKFDITIGGTFADPTIKTGFIDIVGDSKEDLKAKAMQELEKKKKELEDKAKVEADRLRKEAEEKARQEADRLKKEAELKKKEAEEKARKEAERLKKEAEEKAKREADEIKKKAEEEAKKKLKGLIKKP